MLRKSLTGWDVPSTVAFTTCTRDTIGNDDIDVKDIETVYVPDVAKLYKNYQQDHSIIENFEFMDRVITVAKREQFIKTIQSGATGTHCQQAFLRDLSTPGIDTNMLTWVQILRADSLYAMGDDIVLYDNDVFKARDHHSDTPISLNLIGIINRSGLDLLLAMYIVYGMNYE